MDLPSIDIEIDTSEITIDSLLLTPDAPFDPARAWRAQRRLRLIHRAMGEGSASAAEAAEAERIGALLASMGVSGTVVRIPSAVSARLLKEVTAMSSRSVRAGAGPIELRMLGHGHFSPIGWPAARAGRGDADRERVSMSEYEWVELAGPAVRSGHYEILARLVPSEDRQSQSIRRLPSLSGQAAVLAIERWTGQPQICEHCQTLRRRAATYLVWDERDGGIRQIGKSCLADYTGAKLTDALLRRAEQYQELLRQLVDPAGPWQQVSTYAHVVGHRTDSVLLACAVLSRLEDGYHTRASLNFYEANRATAPRAWELLEDRKLQGLATDADRATVLRLREFIAQLDSGDDHHASIQAAAALPYASRRDCGTLGSALAIYEREQQVELPDDELRLDEFFGEVGERYELVLRVIRALELEAEDGGRFWLIIARDDAGRHFRLGRRRADMDIGGTYRLTASVRAHDESEEHGRVTALANPRGIHEQL